MSEIIYIPENIYIMMMIIDLIIIYYSFTIRDNTFYTDIFTTLLSMFLSALLAYNSIIGIGYNQALASSVQYDYYISKPIMFFMIGITLIMTIVLIAKIIDNIKQKADEEKMLI